MFKKVLVFIFSALVFSSLHAHHSTMHLDYEALGNEFKAFPENSRGWNDQNGGAAKYKVSGSNYRTYRPAVSQNADGGLLITTKMDHIRGLAKDDHCFLELTVKPTENGGHEFVRINVNFQIRGYDPIIEDIILTAADGTEYEKLAKTAAKIYEKLSKWVNSVGEHGGRKVFPKVVTHNLNFIAHSVRD